MMQKNKTGLVFAGVYVVGVMFAFFAFFTGGELGGIPLLILSLPWYLIISPVFYFLIEFLLPQDFYSVMELLSLVLSVSFNMFMFYYIGKFFSKLWNKTTM